MTSWPSKLYRHLQSTQPVLSATMNRTNMVKLVQYAQYSPLNWCCLQDWIGSNWANVHSHSQLNYCCLPDWIVSSWPSMCSHSPFKYCCLEDWIGSSWHSMQSHRALIFLFHSTIVVYKTEWGQVGSVRTVLHCESGHELGQIVPLCTVTAPSSFVVYKTE